MCQLKILLILIVFLFIPVSQPLADEAVANTDKNQRKERLAERDQLAELTEKLQIEGKLPEAIQAATAMLAIEREVLGEVHDDVAGSLSYLSELSQMAGDLDGTARWSQAALELEIRLHGEKSHQVRKAQATVTQVDMLRRLTPEQMQRFRAQWLWRVQAKQHWREGRFSEAAELEARVSATRKDLFGSQDFTYGKSLADLALDYTQLGRWGDAEPLYPEALDIMAKVLGEESPDYAAVSHNQGWSYYLSGKAALAEAPLTKALTVRRKLLGPEAYATGVSCNALGLTYKSLNRYAEAERMLAHSLAIQKQAVGEDHWEYGVTAMNLAGLFSDLNRYVEAEPLLKTAETVILNSVGENHREYANILATRATLLENLGRYREAVDLRELEVKVRASVLGPDHPELHLSKFLLGVAYRKLERHTDAERVFREAFKWFEQQGKEFAEFYAYCMRELAFVADAQHQFQVSDRLFSEVLSQLEKSSEAGQRSGNYVGTLNLWGESCIKRGDFEQGERHLLRALELTNDADLLRPFRAGACSRLVDFCRQTGRMAEAEQYARKNLDLRRSIRPESLDHADAIEKLASVFVDSDRLAEAEQLYEKSLEIQRRMLGDAHPSVAVRQFNLGLFRAHSLGRIAEAEPILRQSLEVMRNTYGPAHTQSASALSGLAAIYYSLGRYVESRELFTEALEILQESVGENTLLCANTRTNLGNSCFSLHEFAAAEEHFERALQTLETLVGHEHPQYAFSQSGLAITKLKQGDFAVARSLVEQSAESLRLAYGENHAKYFTAINKLAWIDLASGDMARGMAELDRMLSFEQQQFGNVSEFSTEKAMREFEEYCRPTLRILVSVAAKAADAPQATAQAFDWTLRRKGVVFDAVCRFRESERQLVDDPDIRGIVQQQRQVQQRLSNLALMPPADVSAAEVLQVRTNLQEEVNRLEVEFRRRLVETHPELNTRGDPINGQQLQARLGSDVAYVDFVRLYAFDPLAKGEHPNWMPAHYFAFVLQGDPSAKLALVDLGLAEPIDVAIGELRDHLESVPRWLATNGEEALEEEYRSLASVLSRQIWAPIAKFVGKANTVFLSPDSELNRIAFETLVDENGEYLLERFHFAYVTSGRDLLRSDEPRGTGVVIFANPDFDFDFGLTSQGQNSMLAQTETQRLERAPSLSRDARGGKWKRLPGAAGEATDLAQILDGSSYGPIITFTDLQAQETKFKQLSTPRILHIATHGYFFEEQRDSQNDMVDALSRGGLSGAAVGYSRLSQTENPLLRSGLVLAGANRIAELKPAANSSELTSTSPSPGAHTVDDGWLTAEEISAIDLKGTDLVVLSACETGLGDVPTGEGVQGLRRAFLYAGARTLVTSLYKVPDDSTRSLMTKFYSNLLNGKDKLAALQDAQLATLHERRKLHNAAHPYFWGSFVLVGKPN